MPVALVMIMHRNGTVKMETAVLALKRKIPGIGGMVMNVGIIGGAVV